ncbi:hypothetical protein HYDPIDRAFT_104438 [Hydnomerulius pinastri MD-312]|nr:hypothetical protein HYDPIDRAFT_104438 [Hydnomerulius pinastri MD-312]
MAEIRQDEPFKACKCLNVRIRPLPQPGKPPGFLIASPGDSEYTLTYVGEQGLTIAHPQVTMRTRKMGPPISDSSRCIRFTTLTCLICQTLAYRVQQLVPLEIDGQEGPLLPSLDWMEQDTLMSSCGWVEVHKSCLTPGAAARLSSSPSYSPTFGVAVPQSSVQPAKTSAQPAPQASQDSPQPSLSAGSLLSDLKPLFPPAPFVPSHPVFSHLSSIASGKSDSLRSAAEEHLAAIIRDKIAELEKAEDKLRGDVEDLWRKFIENMGEVDRERGGGVGETRRRDTSRGLTLNTSGVSGTPLVSVRNFVPVASPTVRVMSPTSPVARVSSLSASLATAAFHHPRALQEQAAAHERSSSDSPRSPPPYSSHPSSYGTVDSRSLSSSAESSPELSPSVKGENIIQPFKRSMDESRDTAVSFRYFTILEADVARAREREGAAQPNAGSEEVAHKPGNSAKGSGDSKAAKVTGGTQNRAKDSKETKDDRSKKSDGDIKGSTGGMPRDRRKVTFDIKAEALSADGASAEKIGDVPSARKGRDSEEMIFDLEDGSSEPDSSDAAPVLPFIETSQVPLRRGRQRLSNHAGLPASLSSLRPTSLPVYSTLRSRIAEGTATKQLRGSNTNSPHPASPTSPNEDARTEHPEHLDPQEEEILKLVAANTPSHRGAWRRNSNAWHLFVSRQNGRDGTAGAFIPEESEDISGLLGNDTDDSDWDASRDSMWSHAPPGIPASLPINIGPLSNIREPLSLASYQPKTSLAERAGTTGPPLLGDGRHTSSVTLRKASYAERDRSRSMDPGALDFVREDGEDGDEDESEEEPNKADFLDVSRGRQRALKILEARSKLPAAGMWRSFA